MPLAKPYILIADDDPEDSQALSDEFCHNRPEITFKQVEGGPQLIHFLNECPSDQLPAIIVLDYHMPTINGPQILRQLAADDRYKTIIKVIWSTSRRSKDMEECRRLGAAHYLVKPDTVAGLKNTSHQLADIFESGARPIS